MYPLDDDVTGSVAVYFGGLQNHTVDTKSTRHDIFERKRDNSAAWSMNLSINITQMSQITDSWGPYSDLSLDTAPFLQIVLPKCRLMNSKMRPQMMAFDNVDGDLSRDLKDVVLIYKKGDDLRQDRLTLQLLKVQSFLRSLFRDL